MLYFDTKEEHEEAIISFQIPQNARSFSLSFKIGNSYPSAKIGYQDCANVTIGFGKGNFDSELNGITTPNIIGEEKFVKYSLGTEDKPIMIPVERFECLYFQIKTRNAGNDNMDVYFGDFDLQFYDTEGVVEFARYVPFEKQQTSEKVLIGDDMVFTLILRILLSVFIIASGVFMYLAVKKRKKSDIITKN